MERPAQQAATVLRWLLLNPVEFEAILTLAELSGAPSGYEEGGESSARVRRYLQGALFGLCSACAYPVVWMPDGRELAWPQFESHQHWTANDDGRAVGTRPDQKPVIARDPEVHAIGAERGASSGSRFESGPSSPQQPAAPPRRARGIL